MQKIDLLKTDTSKFLYNPNSDSFVLDLQKDIPELLSWKIKTDKLLFMRYLAVMYDIASPLNRVYQSTSFMTRKLYACQAAGFRLNKDGRLLDKEMEDYLVGRSDSEDESDSKNYYLNDITVKFIRQYGRPAWMYVLAYMAILDDYTRQSLSGSVDRHVPEVIDKVTLRLNEKKNEILFTGGEEESNHLTKLLYKEIEKDRSILSPEKIHEQIHSDSGDLANFLTNPHGDYDINKMEFLGDE